MAKIVKANEIILNLLEYFTVSATIFGIFNLKDTKKIYRWFFLNEKNTLTLSYDS